jgi:hypothetical protein
VRVERSEAITMGAWVSSENTRQFLAIGFGGAAVFIALCVAAAIA